MHQCPDCEEECNCLAGVSDIMLCEHCSPDDDEEWDWDDDEEEEDDGRGFDYDDEEGDE